MPRYDYKCSFCGFAQEEFFPIAKFEKVRTCPRCCVKDVYVHQINTGVSTDLRPFSTPIDMYSIAMEDPDEIREFKQKCPDVRCSDDPADEMYGVPVAEHRKGKLQALKAAGYVEKN